MYRVRSLFVVIPVVLYIVNKSTNGLGKKSGNCEVRKKSSSYIRVSLVLRAVE